MGVKKCITYKKSKTKEMALHTINNQIEKISKDACDIDVLRKLCGAISYNSLFLIDFYKLEENRKYTAESVCQYVQGLLKRPTYEFLSTCMDLSVEDDKIGYRLTFILDEGLFGEIVSQFDINAKDLYCSFLMLYAQWFRTSDVQDKVRELWDNSTKYVSDVWLFARNEVLYAH